MVQPLNTPQSGPSSVPKPSHPFAPFVGAYRGQVGGVLNMPQPRPLYTPTKRSPILRPIRKQPMICDGKNASSLKESIELFYTESGDRIAVATDKGIGYKNHNQDRVLVIPAQNVLAVVDGIGGKDDGDKAAQIFAEEVQNSPQDFQNATLDTSIRLLQEGLDNAGTCFVGNRVVVENGEKFLEVTQAGDVKTIVFDEHGNVIFESKDESLVQEKVNRGEITPDEALYNKKRNIVTHQISADSSIITTYPRIPLKKGYRVVSYTDGIGDNFTPSEIWHLIKGKSAEEAIALISDASDVRMRGKDLIIDKTDKKGGREKLGRYVDGYLSKPKRDNRGIGIIDVN
ncbi:hypothetical protein KJ742_05180 [Patescibacteria group bacterium]|nr:hypothetical protein [Patescibacteria group bacterium]MBU1683312.1 hypothetical protein [Patescibacteria group bacterium]